MDGDHTTSIAHSVLWRLGTVVVVAIMIIWLVIWAVFFRGNTGPKTATNSNKPPTHTSAPAQNGKSSSSGKSSSPKSSNPGSGPVSSSGSKSSNSSPSAIGKSGQPGSSPKSTSPQQLNNTGPGSVVALFAGSVIIGAAGTHYLQRRRAATA